ncbi:MAG: carbohydrate-binding domain-containing protein [Bacteroidaceae bacterium]|nr:carbohydrate-binding domain-containing protein [Bacteroidaceae bacterium]
MKSLKYILASGMAIGLLALSAAEIDGLYFWKNGTYIGFSVGDILFANSEMTVADTTFNVADVDSITFKNPDEIGKIETNVVYVNYDGNVATVTPENVKGISVEVDGATVNLTNTNTDFEMTFILSGESTTGSFTYNGEYKACIRLAGLSLKSTTGAALDIKCGKRIALELLEGTENYLEDAPDSLGQKAALYCKGHLEVSKGGTLTVKGNYTHAIKTKEYMLVKTTTGGLSIAGAEGDGIHAGQYFKMNGSTVSVNGVKGDGIQAEATQEGDENDGQVIIKGGTLDVSVTERDVAAIKCDSLINITGGTITINTTGDGDKAIKSKADMTIGGGDITITQSGQYIVENNDPGYVTAIKADGSLSVSGGSITIENNAEAGKGLSADGDLNIADGETSPIITIKALGSGAALDYSRNVEVADGGGGDGGGDDPDEPETVYRICVALSSTTSQYWHDVVYLYSSTGTRIAQLTNTITVQATGQTTRTFYYYDFDEAPDGQFYFASDDYTRQGGGGPGGGAGQTYTIRTSAVNGPTEDTPAVYYYINTSSPQRSGNVYTFTVTDYTSRYEDGAITDSGSVTPSSGKFATAAGIKGDGNITIGGGTIVINNTGAAAKGISCDKVLTTTGGNITITNSGTGTGTTSSYSTAKGLTSDGSIELQGGTISITMSGQGGKGIKSDGTIVIGKSDTEGPVLTVNTTGAKYLSTSSAKAIKAQGTITVNGGEMTVGTSQDGAEGMESKLKANASIVFNGGKHYFKCYDDCINTAGCIKFAGGIVVCYSNGNDAIDSNYGQAGAIQIGNGAVLSYTTAGGPEEGFDCDNNSYIQITGNGIGISAGGSQGGGGGGWGGSGSSSSIGSAVQGYYLSTSSISYQTGRYYTLADASGNNLVTYALEGALTSSLSLFTATGMTKGSTYTLKYNSSKPTDATTEWHGLYLGSSATGTTQVQSFTAQ